jgi:primosomal protein N''
MINDVQDQPTQQEIINKVHDTLRIKMQKVVDDFASGAINRKQFHMLYERYQRQLTALMEMSYSAQSGAMAEQEIEDTIALKKRLTARVLGLSIYSNKTGLPIETLGNFQIDPALFIPMLSSYRSVTAEVFRAGIRSTAMENDQSLCFVPGKLTTLVALFSFEPSTFQLASTERMHQDFERANAASLEKEQVDPAKLAYPFASILQRVSRQAARPLE